MTWPTTAVPDYHLVRRIGRGSYGDVWVARSVTGQLRAVKLVYRDRFDSDRPFEREFSGIRKFESVSQRHPSQLNLFHVGRNDVGGFFYYVMELADPATGPALDGSGTLEDFEPRTLRSELEQRGRLPVSEVLALGERLAEALHFLHRSGLIHRDIKPSNIIFVEGRPKLADIGLITAADSARTFVGTEGFVPPEGPGTVVADVFALGKVLYEAATGRDRTEFPRLPERLETLPDRPALMELNEVWLKACDPEPGRRYASAALLRDDLLLLGAGRSMRRWRRVERRLRVVTSVSVIVTLLALLALAAGLWANRERLRAVEAERELSERFVEQQLALARATRLTGRPGQRERTLEIIREAARRTNSLALRNEAVAALALPDVRATRTLPVLGSQWAFDPALERYATNDPAGNLHLHSLADHRPLALLPAPTLPGMTPASASLHRFGFSPDGREFGAAYTNLDFLVWPLAGLLSHQSAPTAGPAAAYPRHLRLPPGVRNAVTVPRSRWLAADASDGQLRFFNLDTGALEHTLAGPVTIADVAWHPDGRRFAQRLGEQIVVRDLHSGATNSAWPTGRPVSAVFWHPDGVQVLSVSDRLLHLWNAETGAAAGVFAGHEAQVVGVSFDGRGEWLATTSWDNQTILWSVASQSPLLRLAGAGNGLHFSPDGRRILFQNWAGDECVLFELSAPPVLHRLEMHPHTAVQEGNRDLWRVAFLDRGLLAGVSNEGFSVWPHDRPGFGAHLAVASRHVFNPATGGRLLTADDTAVWTQVLAWDDATDRVEAVGRTRVTPETMDGVQGFAASIDGSRLAVHNRHGEIFLSASTNEWRRLPGPPAVLLSMDTAGRRVAGLTADGACLVWSCPDGRLSFHEPGRWINAGLSPDGRWLLAGSADEFRIWDLEAGGRVAHARPRDAITGPMLAWSADSRWVLVNDNESLVRLLDAGTWAELVSLPTPTMLRSPAFSPDGQWLALPGEKSGVQLWNLREVRTQLRELGLDLPEP